jgi:lysophospholipase L1-like esterase
VDPAAGGAGALAEVAVNWIAWIAAAAALAFVAAELAARAWIRLRGRYFVWRPHERTHMELDRESLPTLEPLVRFEINAEGERGGELPSDRRGLYRVLVAGGSAAEGYMLDQSSSWAGALEELLSRPEALSALGARRVHVGNIARSLVPCASIARMLDGVLPRYDKLDLVLLMVGASDMVDWLETRCPPQPREQSPTLEGLFDEHCERPFGWSPQRLALRQIYSGLRRRLGVVQRRQRTGAKLIELRRRRANAAEWIDVAPDPAPMLARFERYLEQLVRAARAKGARVIVVRQPWFEKDFTPEEEAVMWNFCVGRPYVEPTTSYYTHRLVNELMHAIDERASLVAERLGVEQLDLMPHLDRSLATYYDFLHFTPTGARAVAELVAKVVTKR